jgi:2-polyprenyl-3-methyl-5-hydroxy-6-metoxy-1,4-benzoquinol methylase
MTVTSASIKTSSDEHTVMNNVYQTLIDLDCSELISGLVAWGYPRRSVPYSDEILHAFEKQNIIASEQQKREFLVFKTKYQALSSDKRDELCLWAYASFANHAWTREGKKFNRPEWALKNFFAKYNIASGTLLDVAPAHGHHGVLIFRERLSDMKVETCDMLPCFTKLLTLYGLDVEHYDARFDRLDNVYAGHSFNAITCTEVLEHVDDESEKNILSGLATIVKPGGKVLFTFPVHALTQTVPEPMGHIRQPNTKQIAERCQVNFLALEDGEFDSGKTHQRFLILERK